jgi:dolichol-phosphate mannosyltransferase
LPQPLPPAVLIIIPTYNEADNVEITLQRVHAAVPLADVLIVDDGSPDGTGDIADRLAVSDSRTFVMHRASKSGLGAAYLAGFAWALQRPYDFIGEFDADGSHPADALPRMVAAATGPKRPSLVIGSRWVRSGTVVNWPKSRELLSRAGNAYARFMLQLPVADATAGFRLFRADALRGIRLDEVDSKGYCFQVDLTLRVLDAGGLIVEIPIEFREREHGESKMSRSIVVEAMAKVTLWGIQRAARRVMLPRLFGLRSAARRSSAVCPPNDPRANDTRVEEDSLPSETAAQTPSVSI